MSTTQPDKIESILHYTNGIGMRSVEWRNPLETVPDAADEDTTVGMRLSLFNARKITPAPTLATHGFELVRQRPSLTYNDFIEAPPTKIKDRYYGEMAALICAHTGAKQCVSMHHVVRSADKARNNANVQGPAGAAHADYTTRQALGAYDLTCPHDMQRAGRFLVINSWRNINDKSPIYNDHLAMCDATSVVAPDDFVPFDIVQKNGTKTESYRLDCGHASRHRWYYYPFMAQDEVLLFVQYDSDTRNACRYTFHTSVKDPTCPPNAPFRESIELRCIAFFPDHPFNTIPAAIASGSSAVRAGTTKIMSIVNHLPSWDDNGRRWLKGVFYGPGGVERTVRHIAKEHVRDKARGGEMDDATFEEIVKRIVDAGDFKRTVEQLLPAPTEADRVPEAVAAMTNGVKPEIVQRYWDANGKNWARDCMAQGAAGIALLASGMVKHASEKGEHGLLGASQEVRRQVVEGLMASAEFVSNCNASFK